MEGSADAEQEIMAQAHRLMRGAAERAGLSVRIPWCGDSTVYLRRLSSELVAVELTCLGCGIEGDFYATPAGVDDKGRCFLTSH